MENFLYEKNLADCLSMPVENLTFTIYQLKIHDVATVDLSMNV
jgi:hypothetical protein